LISREKLLELYTAMMKCRMAAQAAAVTPGEQGCAEATYAGVALDLARTDTLHAAPRHALAGLVRGAAVRRTLLALDRSKRTPRVAADPLGAACDAARKHKTAKKQSIAVVFCGDTEATAAQWKRSLGLTARRGLPVVFVSLRSAGEAPAFLGTPTVTPETMAFGVPLITVDGDDLVAVYRVAFESMARARQLRIPTLIDAVTASGADCIKTMEAWLGARDLFRPALRLRIRRDFSAKLEAACLSLAH
jgi:hypothetical protein